MEPFTAVLEPGKGSMRRLTVELEKVGIGTGVHITLSYEKSFTGKITVDDTAHLMRWLREALVEVVVCTEDCQSQCMGDRYCRCGCHAVKRLL